MDAVSTFEIEERPSNRLRADYGHESRLNDFSRYRGCRGGRDVGCIRYGSGKRTVDSSTTTGDVSSREVALESTTEGMDHLIRQAIELELEGPQVAMRAFHEYSKLLDLRLSFHIANRRLTRMITTPSVHRHLRLAQSAEATPEFQRPLFLSDRNVIFSGASVYEFKMSESHVGIKAGHPYLTYDAGEVIIHQLLRNGRWALLTTPFRFPMRSKKRASSGLPEIMMRIPSRSIGYGTKNVSNWRAA